LLSTVSFLFSEFKINESKSLRILLNIMSLSFENPKTLILKVMKQIITISFFIICGIKIAANGLRLYPIRDCGERHYQPRQKLDAGDAARKPLKPL
jgi:hypothetical protein